MKPLISVIIPIYRAEKYINKCLSAVRMQTYENLEIILVEDGSPDCCGEICDRLATEDNRIKVIHKENGGAATARNAGLDQMTGEYVTFVDADDYMESNYIATLYDLLTEYDAQVSICGFVTEDEDGKAVYIDRLHEEIEKKEETGKVAFYTGNDIILQDLRGHWEHVAPWGKLYKANLFEDVRYPKWPAYEDEHVFIAIFDKVEKVVRKDVRLYHYVQHSGSLMNSEYSEKARSTILHMWRERIEYYEDGQERHREIINCIKQAFVAWNVLFLALHAQEMNSEQSRELKAEIRKNIGCLFHGPHLYSKKESLKLFIKSVMALLSTNILRKRYEK